MKRGTDHEEALILALAFAFTTGMAAAMVIAHGDQAMAQCDSGSCTPYGG
jgi:hypothetical protein